MSDGNGGANYAITFANDTTGEITARAITVTATTDTKAFDGTTTSAGIPTVTSGTLAGDGHRRRSPRPSTPPPPEPARRSPPPAP